MEFDAIKEKEKKRRLCRLEMERSLPEKRNEKKRKLKEGDKEKQEYVSCKR